MIVSEEVAHIKFHVDAEAADTDPSQIAGVQIRADQVSSMVGPLQNNNDDVTRTAFLDLLRNRVSGPPGQDVPALLAEINAFDPDDNGEQIQLTLQSWVGKGPRPGRQG